MYGLHSHKQMNVIMWNFCRRSKLTSQGQTYSHISEDRVSIPITFHNPVIPFQTSSGPNTSQWPYLPSKHGPTMQPIVLTVVARDHTHKQMQPNPSKMPITLLGYANSCQLKERKCHRWQKRERAREREQAQKLAQT